MIKIEGKNYETPTEYAKLKGVTLQTVYNWIKKKEVKTRQLIGKSLIEL